MPLEGTVGPQSLSAPWLLVEVFGSTPMLLTWESSLTETQRQGREPPGLHWDLQSHKPKKPLLLLRVFHYISKAKGGTRKHMEALETSRVSWPPRGQDTGQGSSGWAHLG